jgi:tetratricopeptide (TPR) repeat protein
VQYRSQLKKAKENAELAVQRDPAFADAHFLLGRIHRLLQWGDEGTADLTRAIELDPAHLRAFLERALMRLDLYATKYSMKTISLRTSTRRPQFTWPEGDAQADVLRRGILADLESAGRLAGREYEKALLQGASELVVWRSGSEDRLQRAEEHLLRARSLMPNDPAPLRLLSLIRMMRGDFPKAAEYAATSIELAPNDHVLLYHASTMLFYADRVDESLAASERALRINPGHTNLLNMRGNILTRKRDFEGARRAFEEGLRIQPRNTTMISNLGYLYYQMNRLEDGAATYGRAVEADPADPDGYEGRAVCLMGLGKFAEAEKDMDAVIARRPTSDSYSNRGAMRSRGGRYAEAMEDYRQALKISPENAAVHFNLAILCARQGKHADAVESYRRAIELGRVQADGHVGLAKALIKLRRFAEAEEASTKAIDLAPDSGGSYADRAQSRAEQGKAGEALDDYLKALERMPDDNGILRDVGLIQLKAGRYPQALPYLQRARDLGKADAGSLLGECLLQLGRLEDADAAFTQAVKDLPKDSMVLFGRSRVRQQQARRAEAIADLDAAIALAPTFAEAFGLRGVLKLEEKRRTEAAADLKRAIELKPSLKPAFGPSLLEATREE